MIHSEFEGQQSQDDGHGIYLLNYGAGNVRSLVNAVKKLGFTIRMVESCEDITVKAKKLIFPGVGAFGSAIHSLKAKGYDVALKKYIESGRPYMGICVGMQALFASSEESPDVEGLAIVHPSINVSKFNSTSKAVPHMGWNAAVTSVTVSEENHKSQKLLNHSPSDIDTRYYFVHSYAVNAVKNIDSLDSDWSVAYTTYGDETFISAIKKKNVFATQFHPEKSGTAGLAVLNSFLSTPSDIFTALTLCPLLSSTSIPNHPVLKDKLSRRIIACLDVRSNDAGDLVVTKGDQYDVREKTGEGQVRNLGKPVELAHRYFVEGADEITFLNITSFRDCPIQDLPMLAVLQKTSESVFVPLTIGGGIRGCLDENGRPVSALQVAGEYFKSGADKVSIGSDAVYAAEDYFFKKNRVKDGSTAIEQIAHVYGSQAVVISVDPRRVYVDSPESAPGHHVISTSVPGPNGEKFVWYQCTVKGGREGRDLDVWQLVTACEDLGAGEILCNCMDKDGTNSGYDLELLADVKKSVSIPVIASSGAGEPLHFTQVFAQTNVEAALAAGIFHRREVPIAEVKTRLNLDGYEVRLAC